MLLKSRHYYNNYPVKHNAIRRGTFSGYKMRSPASRLLQYIWPALDHWTLTACGPICRALLLYRGYTSLTRGVLGKGWSPHHEMVALILFCGASWTFQLGYIKSVSFCRDYIQGQIVTVTPKISRFVEISLSTKFRV
jgi:hypothetical protein